jgi:hypothetical protein
MAIVLCTFIFIIVNVPIFRLIYKKDNENKAMAFGLITSALIGGVSSSYIIGNYINLYDHRAIISVSAALTFLGFGGIYAILGPISAARSISAHSVLIMDGCLTKSVLKADLLKRYSAEMIFSMRFAEWEKSKIIITNGDRIILTKKGVQIARFFNVLSKIYFKGQILPSQVKND